MRSPTLAVLLLLLSVSVLYGQTEYLPKKVYCAYRIDLAPVINGVFDDIAWQNGNWAGDFTQLEPYADRPPSQQTEFKVSFDDMNLYIAIKALDSSPDSITNRMSRRK